ncbi:MAG: metallophosphoesterase [Defluviitaleaceae bacterium]|nr:metallophosphoesterase [Defluviitaleaceae bacterium]
MKKYPLLTLLTLLVLLLTLAPSIVSANTPYDYRNLSMAPGRNETIMHFTFHSGFSQDCGIKIWEQDGAPTPYASTVSDTFTVQRPTAEGGTSTYYVHKVTITDLEPDTIYNYAVFWAAGESEPKSFKTGGAENFQFIITADAQMGTGGIEPYEAGRDNYDWLTAMALTTDIFKNAQLLVSLGDQTVSAGLANPQNATPSQLQTPQRRLDAFFSPPSLHRLPIIAATGNHDADATTGGLPNLMVYLWHRHFNTPIPSTPSTSNNVWHHNTGHPTAIDYWTRYGDVLFIHLDSNTRTLSGNRLIWFNSAISQNQDALWRVAVMHHSPYSVARSSTDSAKTQIISAFIPEFEKAGIDIVLSGHDHAYSRSHHLRGTGSTTSRIRANQLWVSPSGEIVQGNNAEYTVLNPDGISYIAVSSPTRSNIREATAMPRSYISRHVNSFFVPDPSAPRPGRTINNLRHMSVADVTPDTFSIATYAISSTEPESMTMVDLYTIVRNPDGNTLPDTPIPQFNDTPIFRPEKPPITHTVTFAPDCDEYIGELVQTVSHGGAAVAPHVKKLGWLFDFWDTDFSNVTEDLYVTAQWLRLGAISTDGKGGVSSADVVWLARHVAGHAGFEIWRGDRRRLIADMDGDGEITANDVSVLMKWLVGYDLGEMMVGVGLDS